MTGLKYLPAATLILVALVTLTIKSIFFRKELAPGPSKTIGGQLAPTANGDLRTIAGRLNSFVKAHGFNPGLLFLVDMRLESGRNRFFVYNSEKDSILLAGLVAHGSCDHGFNPAPVFSNQVNSGCSCLGKFRLGKSYQGSFGLAYKLMGMDKSNSNAMKRNIVLHAYACVPEKEIFPLPICNSRGCPMLSPRFLQQIKVLIDHSDKPILLYIFDQLQ